MDCLFLKKKLKEIELRASHVGDNGKEICGLILDNGYFLDIILVKNKAKHKGQFVLCPRDVKKIKKSIQDLNIEIIGTFHSHPWSDAKPSNSDVNNALDDSLMMIYSVPNQNFSLWYIKNEKAESVVYSELDHREKIGWFTD